MVAVGEFALIFVLSPYLINGLGLSTIATAMALGVFFSGASTRYLAAAIGPSGTVLLGLGLASEQLTSLVLSEVPVGQSGQGSATQSTVRQLGSALGAALAGAMLTVGMAASCRGFTGQVAQVADAARASAGASISAIRDAGMPGDVLAPVVGAFADGTRLALVSAVAALAIGLVGAVMVGRSARAGAPADGRGDEEGR